jgi:hypothetical protein
MMEVSIHAISAKKIVHALVGKRLAMAYRIKLPVAYS